MTPLWRRLRATVREWWLCHTKRCSYVEHYLAYGPAELTHESFHAAERKCREAQARLEHWFATHEGQPPHHLVALCEAWERRVRA